MSGIQCELSHFTERNNMTNMWVDLHATFQSPDASWIPDRRTLTGSWGGSGRCRRHRSGSVWLGTPNVDLSRVSGIPFCESQTRTCRCKRSPHWIQWPTQSVRFTKLRRKRLVAFYSLGISQNGESRPTQNPHQWRIQDFPDGGGANPRGGAPTYYLTNFSQKLHENEENLTQRGGGARPCAPPP